MYSIAFIHQVPCSFQFCGHDVGNMLPRELRWFATVANQTISFTRPVSISPRNDTVRKIVQQVVTVVAEKFNLSAWMVKVFISLKILEFMKIASCVVLCNAAPVKAFRCT